jgi:hypothetical protein
MRMTFALMLPLSLLSATVHAADNNSRYKACESAANIAQMTAKNFQDGVSLSTELSFVDQDQAKGLLTAAQSEDLKTFIVNVYAGQRYYTKAAQARAISDVRNEAHVKCLQAK